MQFLRQLQATLNVMCTSRHNNKISAYEETKGAFEFNQTPIEVVGTKSLVFVYPKNQAS